MLLGRVPQNPQAPHRCPSSPTAQLLPRAARWHPELEPWNRQAYPHSRTQPPSPVQARGCRDAPSASRTRVRPPAHSGRQVARQKDDKAVLPGRALQRRPPYTLRLLTASSTGRSSAAESTAIPSLARRNVKRPPPRKLAVLALLGRKPSELERIVLCAAWACGTQAETASRAPSSAKARPGQRGERLRLRTRKQELAARRVSHFGAGGTRCAPPARRFTDRGRWSGSTPTDGKSFGPRCRCSRRPSDSN